MSLLNRIECLLRGHRYRVVQLFGKGARRICCDRCGGDWAMSDDAQVIVPWDQSFAEMYESFGYRILKP